MNKLITISGIVKNLERSTDIQGTKNSISTTHLTTFIIDENRVLLKTPTPSVISNGDKVVLAGNSSNGQFNALACKNLTTNWISPLKQQKIAFIILIYIAISSLLLFFLILPIIFGGICIFFAIKIKKQDNILKQAHQMIENT